MIYLCVHWSPLIRSTFRPRKIDHISGLYGIVIGTIPWAHLPLQIYPLKNWLQIYSCFNQIHRRRFTRQKMVHRKYKSVKRIAQWEKKKRSAGARASRRVSRPSFIIHFVNHLPSFFLSFLPFATLPLFVGWEWKGPTSKEPLKTLCRSTGQSSSRLFILFVSPSDHQRQRYYVNCSHRRDVDGRGTHCSFRVATRL